MSIALRIEQLSKAYRLGELDRGVFFADWRERLFGTKRRPDPAHNVFWALQDVSFDIHDGEVIGLLGRNGAGKSTLLKIISQITAPTSGRIKIKGRIASLLEVGTGFHLDLTGRDNVFLNGTILGMTRREVAAKFDEIVAFSGIEQFIDTPVKRYSIGMRVRLAFAVAANLNPEILVIDEVLAVGDAVFQAKCLGKIGEVSRSGRTVLFVSHNAASIESLCTRGVVLEQGRVVFDGSQTDAIDFYAATRSASATDLRSRKDRSGTGEVRIVGLELRNSRGKRVPVARTGEDLEVALEFERPGTANCARLVVQASVFTHLGAPVFTLTNIVSGTVFGELPEKGVIVCRFSRLPLPPGHYQIGYRLLRAETQQNDIVDAIDVAAELHVENGDFYGTGKLPPANTGVCLVQGDWRMETATLHGADQNAAIA